MVCGGLAPHLSCFYSYSYALWKDDRLFIILSTLPIVIVCICKTVNTSNYQLFTLKIYTYSFVCITLTSSIQLFSIASQMLPKFEVILCFLSFGDWLRSALWNVTSAPVSADATSIEGGLCEIARPSERAIVCKTFYKLSTTCVKKKYCGKYSYNGLIYKFL